MLVPTYSALYKGSNHPTREYERELEHRVAQARSRYEFRERPPRTHTAPVPTEQLELAI